MTCTSLRNGPFLGGALLAALCLAGCGESGPKIYFIEGQVTYKGEPVKSGTIRFEPASGKMDPRATPEISITDGRYEMPRGKGVAGGAYTVYIFAADGKATEESAYGNALFPPYYVTKVDLPEESTTKDFHIPEQPKGRR